MVVRSRSVPGPSGLLALQHAVFRIRDSSIHRRKANCNHDFSRLWVLQTLGLQNRSDGVEVGRVRKS